MALGEAFVEVKADLRPFRENLENEIKVITTKFEQSLEQAVAKGLGDGARKGGEKAGEDAGDRLGRGMRRKLGDKNASIWTSIAAAMGSALDDGISALPAEIKALIVAGIIAVLPFIGAALTGAITAAVAAGFAGIGIALAFQFEQVQIRGMQLFEFIRSRITESVEPFGQRVLEAFQLIESRFTTRIAPLFDRIFKDSADFVDPIIEGLLGMIELFLEGIESVVDDAGPFIEELSDGFILLGAAIGQALEILVDTGEEGREGLRDLLFLTAEIIVGFARLLAFLTEVYGAIRDVAAILDKAGMAAKILAYAILPVLAPIVEFTGASDDAHLAVKNWGDETTRLFGSFTPLTAATEKQIQATEKLARAFEQARKTEFDLIEANIMYEESLDRLAESLEVNGDTLAFETKEGRDNLRLLSVAIQKLQETVEGRYKAGEINARQAQELYDQEIARIRQLANAWGLTAAEIDNVFGRAIKLFSIEDPSTGWLDKILNAAKLAAIALERAVRAARQLSTGTNTPWGGGIPEFAEGAILTKPTFGLYGEDGPEVVIPMTKPARAAQLIQQSGLDKMFGAMGTMVQVFIGNEQLDSRTVRIVEQANARQGQALAFGAR